LLSKVLTLDKSIIDKTILHNFQLHMYYIKPIAQIKYLNEGDYFKDVRVSSLTRGREIKIGMELKSIEAAWGNYFCVIN
jgi:hypothetical protein